MCVMRMYSNVVRVSYYFSPHERPFRAENRKGCYVGSINVVRFSDGETDEEIKVGVP